MLIFDEFTKDVGSLFTFSQFPTLPSTTNFTGPVAKVVGSEDQLFCTETNRCDNVTALIAAERVAYPDARSFDVVVSQGSGHDLNLDFFAQGAFNTFVGFVDQFSGLM
jgi:hypothetical protein